MEEAIERVRVALDVASYNLTAILNNTRGDVNDLQVLLNAIERGLIALERRVPTEEYEDGEV